MDQNASEIKIYYYYYLYIYIYMGAGVYMWARVRACAARAFFQACLCLSIIMHTDGWDVIISTPNNWITFPILFS